MHDAAVYYLDRYRAGYGDDAFFGLLELGDEIVPSLREAFSAESDSEVRAFITKVLWQRRDPSLIPFLERALNDSSPAVWQQALDGLVTAACPEARAVLVAARSRQFASESQGIEFREWIDEAIEQMNHPA